MKQSTAEDCLEALHALGAARTPVRVPAVARWLGVPPQLATAMLEQIAAQGLVVGAPSLAVRLTPGGQREAARVVRRRRLVESVLIAAQGYPLEAAQVIAARLGYAVSDDAVGQAARLFGEPDLTPRPEPAPAWAVAMRARLAQAGHASPGGGQPPEAPAAPLGDGGNRRACHPPLWPTLPLAKGETNA